MNSVTLAISAMGPTLQQVFIGSGLTTAEQWDELTAAADAGTPLTTSLLASGVDEERLRAVLYDHTVGAVFELMLPSEDSFTFVAGQTHPIGTTFPFPVDEVLEDAGQRVEAWKVIAVAIPSTSMRMRLAHELPRGKLTVSADEWHVLSRVDGRASIAEIIRELGMSAFAVCAVLHRLLQAGAVEPAPDE